MPNKIDGFGHRPVQVTGQDTKNQVKPGETDKSRSGTRAENTDTVRLDSAERLKQLDEVLRSLPVSDKQRVDQVREAIAAGDYKIDAERIAEKLLHMDRDLGKAE